jgi:glyoxylase-like metal-dependent hydrolase (beta-lactamase superfamily II)
MSLFFNGEEIRLIPFPRSHTDGDTVVYFTTSRVLSMGDTIYLVRGNLGPASDDWSGGDLQSLERNLAALLPQMPADVKVIPGHGPVLSLADLQAYHQIIKTALDVVRTGIAQGKSLEKMVAEGLPASLPTSAVWKMNAQAFIETAHESLTRKPK